MKGNPWVFGIIFMALAAYWMWYNLALPIFYPFEKTDMTTGVVYQTELVRPNLPFGLDQAVYYVYKVKDSVFVSEQRFSKRDLFYIIGDSLNIEFSKRENRKSKAISRRKVIRTDIYLEKLKTYFSVTKAKGYKELHLNANIFTYADYASYGKLLLKVSGTFKNYNDTLKLTPLVHHKFNNEKYRSEELIPINNFKIQLSDFLLVNNYEMIEELNSGLILK